MIAEKFYLNIAYYRRNKWKGLRISKLLIFCFSILQSIYLTNNLSRLKSSLQTMNNRSLFRFVISICFFVRGVYYIRKMKDNPNVGISVSRKDFNCSQDINSVSAFFAIEVKNHWTETRGLLSQPSFLLLIATSNFKPCDSQTAVFSPNCTSTNSS